MEKERKRFNLRRAKCQFNGACWDASDWSKSNPSFHTSSPVLKSAPHVHGGFSLVLCYLCVPRPWCFVHTQEIKHSASHRIMNQWVFVDCETRRCSSQRRLHRLTTSHTTNQVLFFFFSLFVQNVENIMIELTIYMYTHTLHAKYCKHSSFLLFDLDFLPFVVGDCTPIILFLTPLNHCSAPSWVTSNAAVWKNKTSSHSQRKEQSPEAGLEDEEKGWGILFLSSRWAVIVSSFQDAFKIKKKFHLKH